MVSLGISDLEDRDVCIKSLSLNKIMESLQSLGKIKFVSKESSKFDFEIKELKCGGNHTLVLLKNGLLFGAGDLKELRNDDYTITDHWVLLNNQIYNKIEAEHGESVLENYKIETISTCWDSSFVALKSDNDTSPDLILSFGQQSKGELGRKDTFEGYTILRVNNSTKLTLHSCLYTTILVVKYDNNKKHVFGWGFNNKGQLKDVEKKTDKKIENPILVKEYNGNDSIKCHIGKDFVVFCDYNNNQIEIRGNNTIVKSFLETKLMLNDINHVDSMWSSVHFNKDGVILGVGNNQLGQLSMNNKTLPKAKFLKCGSEHMIYVSQEEPKLVKSWGWGEHGNCGIFTGDKDKNAQLVFYEPNVIYEGKPDEEIINIYGGCATTFILTK